MLKEEKSHFSRKKKTVKVYQAFLRRTYALNVKVGIFKSIFSVLASTPAMNGDNFTVICFLISL